MSENRPPIEESAPPVQAYAEYPRGAAVPSHHSPEKLQALMDGYYGLNKAFLAFVGCIVLAIVAIFALQASTTGVILFGLFLVLSLVVLGVVSYPYNKRIAYGMNWRESTPLWISLALSLGSIIVSPVIILIVLQLLVMAEIKNYGVKAGFFGVKKKDIKARIAQLRQQSTQDMFAPPPRY